MTKTEFLNLLEQRLMVLNDTERQDVLSEYEQHIEMKMQSGLSEEEAIADFGDPEELIKELLEAYHLNTDYTAQNSFVAQIQYYFRSCAHFLSSTFEALCQMSHRTLLLTLLRFCGLVLFLGILTIAGSVGCKILYVLLVHTLPFGNSIGLCLYRILLFFLYVVFLAFSAYLLFFFFKQQVLIHYQPLEAPSNIHPLFHPSSPSEDGNEMGARMASIQKRFSAFHSDAESDSSVPSFFVSLQDLCIRFVLLCCRLIGAFFLLFAVCSALGLLAGTAIALVFLCMGYHIVGPFLIVLGCTLIALVTSLVLFHFVFRMGGARL